MCTPDERTTGGHGEAPEEPTRSARIMRRGDVHDAASRRRELLEGLRRGQRSIPSKYLYDERGASLFDAITRLPEYYQTRAERRLLERHGDRMARETGLRRLAEIGVGSAAKTRLLLDASLRHGLRTFVGIDVDETTLRQTIVELADEYPDLELFGLVADFTDDLRPLPGEEHPCLAAFLGGTVGNLDPRDEAPAFISGLAGALAAGDRLLLGVDLIKDRETLLRAYDDEAGVTAEFNRNILRNVNRILGSDFDPRRFSHRVVYDEQNDWIEMRLVSGRAQHVGLGDSEGSIELHEGEEIRTEISAKYDRTRTERLLAAGGFELDEWLADDGRFALALASLPR